MIFKRILLALFLITGMSSAQATSLSQLEIDPTKLLGTDFGVLNAQGGLFDFLGEGTTGIINGNVGYLTAYSSATSQFTAFGIAPGPVPLPLPPLAGTLVDAQDSLATPSGSIITALFLADPISAIPDSSPYFIVRFTESLTTEFLLDPSTDFTGGFQPFPGGPILSSATIEIYGTREIDPNVIPLPATGILLIAATGLLAGMRRRQSSKAA